MKKAIASACVVCLALSVLTGCNPLHGTAVSPPNEPETSAHPLNAESARLSEDGQKAYEQGDYDKAITLYTSALEKDEANYAALAGRGVALAMRGNGTGIQEDIRAGIGDIERALYYAPDDTATFYNLALAYKIDGRKEGRSAGFRKLLTAIRPIRGVITVSPLFTATWAMRNRPSFT
ncbi:tetratricopeptide repeat protein [Anaeroglobus geminatus]|uniref:Uncharacterized protein n=1 Tax=Anaeroglobus geminatus F0357 TaxID=861450 RepID=G9YFV0_9FIRM|nr:hypothetical protein [Anaeroglobus geminatus]EHM42703.1 hypothetical protein HMPREF0080_00512 [Anaeroglobus geminatus F0357]